MLPCVGPAPSISCCPKPQSVPTPFLLPLPPDWQLQSASQPPTILSTWSAVSLTPGSAWDPPFSFLLHSCSVKGRICCLPDCLEQRAVSTSLYALGFAHIRCTVNVCQCYVCSPITHSLQSVWNISSTQSGKSHVPVTHSRCHDLLCLPSFMLLMKNFRTTPIQHVISILQQIYTVLKNKGFPCNHIVITPNKIKIIIQYNKKPRPYSNFSSCLKIYIYS